ncbi:hypothetical protein Patl1_24021 [Pistacia atlantica]|jgi:hypothetical protein
MFAH